MARKLEHWLETVPEDKTQLVDGYAQLSPRELPIVAAATLDLALVALLERRLLADPNEQESFLGTNGDGRAPAGSFGARIQLAYLLGLISKHDVEVLRSIKAIRNLFAHRMAVSFSSPSVVKELRRLHSSWLKAVGSSPSYIEKASRDVGDDEIRSQGILMIVFAHFQLYFHNTVPLINSIRELR